MNLLNLRYFLVAAEELNFTRAARRLYISQQSLSGHILKLENYFGVELFDRSPPMTLTSAGTCLMRYAKRMLDSVDELEKEVQTGYNLSSRNLIWDVRRIGLVVPHNGVNDGDHLPTGVANGRHVGLPFIPFFLKIKL